MTLPTDLTDTVNATLTQAADAVAFARAIHSALEAVADTGVPGRLWRRSTARQWSR
jgi:hypothetical protein